MTALQELIERLEKATGPDAELNVACWAVLKGLHWGQRGDGHIRALIPNCACPGSGKTHEHWKGFGGFEPPDHHLGGFGVPNYTSSLDAAMTLVPEGTMASVGRWKHCEAGTWHWSAQILPVCRAVESHEHHEAEAPTGPLALCIAALKSREAANA